MKRVIALLLCFSFVLSFSNISVFADGENYKFARIKVIANKKDYYETVIVDDDTLYMATESIAKYATYNTSKHKLFFMRRDQNDVTKAFKFAFYIESDNTFHVKLGMISKTIKNVKCKKYQDSYYLPIDTIFPYLDSVVSTDKKSLIIDSDRVALSDALYDYNPLDYYFNMSSEFAGNALLATGFYLPSYLFDTATKLFDYDVSFHRLFGAYGSKNDYLSAFESMVVDNSEYLKAMARDPDQAKEVGEHINFLFDLENLFSDASEIDEWLTKRYNLGGDSFTILDLFDEDSRDAIRTMKDVYELIELIYDYLNMAEDHTKMIGSVYSPDVFKVNNKFDKKEYDVSKKANDIYSSSITATKHAIKKFIASQIEDKIVDSLNGIKLVAKYKLTKNLVKATGNVLRKELKLGFTESVPLLPYYVSIMDSSMSACTEHNIKMSDLKNAENQMRLSEIMYLLASEKCYQVMLEVFERYNNKSSASNYQSQINNISARLTLLYQANSHRDSDNYANWNYSDESKAIKKAIKSMSVKGVSEEESNINNIDECIDDTESIIETKNNTSDSSCVNSFDTKDKEYNDPSDFSYIVFKNRVDITKLNKYDLTSIRIPETIEGKPVTYIEAEAFKDCTNLVQVDIPDTVDVIGTSAFEGCTKLKTINLPNSILIIEQRAFYHCISLTEVSLPDKQSIGFYGSIGWYAFGDCTNLIKVTIPASVKSIYYGAFSNCPNLTIYCETGSEAEEYAKTNNIPFVAK